MIISDKTTTAVSNDSLHDPSERGYSRRECAHGCWWICVASLVLATASHAAELQDFFADRELITETTGEISGSNLEAGSEPDEPRHGGKPGGRSLWISWQAPADGIATFWTDGSSFDTLLSAYYFDPPDETTLDRLREAARNDDAPGSEPTSLIQFGARAGLRYEIAVDGYRGAAGVVRFRWDFVNAASPPPIILSVPDDRAAQENDTVTLTVEMQVSDDLDLQWRFNDNSIGVQGPTLVLPSLQATNVGLYSLRVRIDDVRFETTPTELQVNSEGQTNTLARDKLLDALESGLIGSDGVEAASPLRLMSRLRPAGNGVVRGYNGVQIFNTTYATADPDEPRHCDLTGGTSYWLAYQPPADGTLVLDTIGSTYDTFLAVYTYIPPLQGYDGLIPVACDNDSGGAGGAAQLEFAALQNRQFVVVVDGINGGLGIARLNYRLDTNRPPVAPIVTQLRGPGTVAVGTDVILEADILGSPPLQITWFANGTVLPNESGSVLRLPGVQLSASGEYWLKVENHFGLATSDATLLQVLMPPILRTQPAGDSLIISWETIPGHHYSFEQRADLSPSGWTTNGSVFTGNGSSLAITNSMSSSGIGLYRVRVH